MSLIALNLAVLLVVAGGTTAFGAMNKTVTLEVDGHTETVRTFGTSVNDVLKSKGVKLAGEDKVSPAPSHEVTDGDNITVKYARPLTLSVDGKSEDHVVYGATVKELLGRFDVKPVNGAFVSAKPATKIPRKGMELVVSNPKKLKVVSDGDTKKITTATPTVKGVLDEAGVKLDHDDEVTLGKSALVTKDAKLKVVRIKTETKTEEVKVKFPVEATDDATLPKGETKILKPGKPGKKREKVTLVKADGKTRDRIVLTSKVLSEPVKQVEKRGTQEAPEIADGSVWDKIAKCESGGNWSINTGNGYYGGLQFSAATWHSVGGTGVASDHPREEQIKRAVILQKRSGWGQWGCADARFD
jgi:resuscitation-promoting factor RpfB